MTETQVGELLERASADIRTTTDLVAGGIAAGRRRRRRGLALTGAGALAAAAIVGGAVGLAPGNGSAPGHTGVTDRSASTGPSSYAAKPSASAVTQAPADGGLFPVAPDAMASTLATLLDGTVANPNDDQYHLGAPDGWQSGGVDLNGASVSVSYQPSAGPRCDGDQARGNTGCTALGGGFFLSTYSAEITTKGEGRTGARDIGVTYYTPDGYKINATASNAGSADPAHPSMAQPVLDLSALTAIAENPAWR